MYSIKVRQLPLVQSTEFIKLHQFYMPLCVFMVLCHFVICIDLCYYHHNRVTELFHHHMKLSFESAIFLDAIHPRPLPLNLLGQIILHLVTQL